VEAGLHMLNPLPDDQAGRELSPALRLRLWGRYGADMPAVLACAAPDELEVIGDSPCVWAELRWAARAEGVVHLDDLLLRRVRLGLLLPNGGLDCLDRVRAIVQPELGWDDARWDEEARHYSDLWKRCYALRR
jgi:glycerol-3-phosphate dehydrogenase